MNKKKRLRKVEIRRSRLHRAALSARETEKQKEGGVFAPVADTCESGPLLTFETAALLSRGFRLQHLLVRVVGGKKPKKTREKIK